MHLLYCKSYHLASRISRYDANFRRRRGSDLQAIQLRPLEYCKELLFDCGTESPLLNSASERRILYVMIRLA